MEHESVKLEERHFVGIHVRVEEPSTARFFIGALWDKFYREMIITQVEERISDDFFGIYYDYAKDHTKPYSVLAGLEIKKESSTPKGMARVVSPAGNYELYEIIGMFPEELFATWNSIWSDKELKRSFKVDIERYGRKFQTEPPQIDLYIGTS